MRKKLAGILFWSIISAAFIGPGTVTTAARSGADFGMGLLWALLFGTLACLVLQEASARVTLGSGLSLGAAINRGLGSGNRAKWARMLVVTAIFFGCAAYQAGNILGAVSGLEVLWDIPAWQGTLLVTLSAGLGLWFGRLKGIQNLMSVLVAVMGLVFFALALQLPWDPQEALRGLVVPSLPDGSELLALGLIGTTIVPYNLFLASGISGGQGIGEMRFGLSVAVILGGVISMAILVVGAQLSGEFSFENLAKLLDGFTNGQGHLLLGIGLFCAGFTSSVTAPLAAAITWQSVMGRSKDYSGNGFRTVWLAVMLVGFAFGISGYRPIPVILLAQTLNGILLPVSALFLLKVMNQEDVLPTGLRNTLLQNLLMMLVVSIAVMLGLHSLIRVFGSLFSGFEADGPLYFACIGGISVLTVVYSYFKYTRAKI
jgi:Mn2+/Fe2+ NRAMP family transporter